MKICLVRCPSPFLIDEWVFPPLGLMAVATGLKVRGHDVFIHDGPIAETPMDFQYYGFGPTSPEYSSSIEAMKLIRQHNPKAKLVIGGPYATLKPTECVNDGWDCVVHGNGEIVAESAFKDNLPIIIAKNLQLDEYPIIDRSLIDIKKYKFSMDGIHATSLITSRGCPFSCGFCSKNYTKIRLMSAERIIEEIKILHFDFGFKALLFPEDIFIVDRKRVEKVCQYMKELGIIWRCLVRGDITVKYGPSFVKMMKDSGCVEVGMGVESGSPKILSNINKGESVESIKEAIRMLKKDGIRVKGFFIIGLPGESYETINETKQFLDEMKLDDIDAKIFQPYPGSPIWEHKDLYDIDWDNNMDISKTYYKGRPKEYYGNIRTSSLTTEQIYKAWIEIEDKYKRKD